MTDSYARQAARTQGFSLGEPRSFRIAPDGQTVIFLRSRSGTDPVNCLWALDVADGRERLVADPAQVGSASAPDDPLERARRERVRERASGIVAFATDAACTVAAFTLAGAIYLADVVGGGMREIRGRRPAADPRPDPAGRLVAYVSAGVLRIHDVTTGEDHPLADPGGAKGVSFGLAEFIAAEEMSRSRGYWWAPDGSAILTSRVDATPVPLLHIADPANPAAEPKAVRYPAAGQPNAEVSAFVVTLDGTLTEVAWDRQAFPYLVNANWDAARGQTARPLMVVLSRDQREMRILQVDPATGVTELVRSDTDPAWVDIVTGVPARTSDGRVVWTADADGAKRLFASTAAEHAAGTAKPLTPVSINVREVLSVDGDTVLFSASADDPASIALWTAGPGGVQLSSQREGVHDGQLAGGTLLQAGRRLGDPGLVVRVLRRDGNGGGTEAALIGSLAETPSLPTPNPDLVWSSGPTRVRTAILLPSWHRPGSGPLPVLCDPYGGPHGQRVTASASAYLTPQWFAEQGFAVVIADGRGTPGRGPASDRAVAGDLAGPALDDQVEALHFAAQHCADLDLGRVAIRGWSFGGYLAALAVVRRPDVFHAAVAGAPPTDWRLYDTCYTERYLGHPDANPQAYEHSSLLAHAAELRRPLLLIHGMVDDNVVVAHTLRLSAALLAAGRPHSFLPLSGVTHMASQEDVAENMLLLQVDFLRSALGIRDR